MSIVEHFQHPRLMELAIRVLDNSTDTRQAKHAQIKVPGVVHINFAIPLNCPSNEYRKAFLQEVSISAASHKAS